MKRNIQDLGRGNAGVTGPNGMVHVTNRTDNGSGIVPHHTLHEDRAAFRFHLQRAHFRDLDEAVSSMLNGKDAATKIEVRK